MSFRRSSVFKKAGRFGLFALLLMSAAAIRASAADEVNVVQSIRSAAPPPGQVGSLGLPAVEVQINSTKEFPVRDEIVILNIGGKEFSFSRSPADGSLSTLIFSIPGDAWAALKTGDAIVVYFGQDDPKGGSEFRWTFGTLDKSLLDKP